MRLKFILSSFPIVATGFTFPSKIQQAAVPVSVPFHKRTTASASNIHPFGVLSTSTTELKSSEQSNYGKDNTDWDDEDEDSDYDDDDEAVNEVDWRSFRAHLVSIYDQDVSTMADGDNNIKINNDNNNDNNILNNNSDNIIGEDSWIYETGSTVETGTVLLHKIDGTSSDKNVGYGLGRQYLHKSVVLILEHEDNDHYVSTKGVILNRPTDLILHDQAPDDNDDGDESFSEETSQDIDEFGFRISFGGFDWGIHTSEPKFFCLHSIKSTDAKDVSREVINGIYFTSIQHAKDLISNGIAKSNDFLVYSGFIEWEEGELMKEIEEGSWHTVATDASIVRKGLKVLAVENEDTVDIEHTGIQTWTMLMDLIHQNNFEETTQQQQQQQQHQFKDKWISNFDDMMLKEWAKKFLCFTEAPLFLQDDDTDEEEDEDEDEEVDIDVMELIRTVTGHVLPGSIIRASDKGFPFLLSEQEFHKSLILIVQDDHEMSVGLILNHPSRKTFELSYQDESHFFPTTVHLPVRFGGSYGGPAPIHDPDEDGKPLYILHMNEVLRDANVGEPISENYNEGIWSCSAEECAGAIANGLATSQDFMCVDGFCLWPKHLEESGNVGGGVMPEISKGDFELVSHVRNSHVWESLLKQEVLSSDALTHNFNIAQSAWSLADQNCRGDQKIKKLSPVEDEDASMLNDEALKRWMMTYLNN